MSNMFGGCSSLTELNLSSFNTNNVAYMDNMFTGCASLKELNLSNFTDDNLIDIKKMFFGCSSLKRLNIQHLNIKNLSYYTMFDIFGNCVSLKKVNAKNSKKLKDEFNYIYSIYHENSQCILF